MDRDLALLLNRLARYLNPTNLNIQKKIHRWVLNSKQKVQLKQQVILRKKKIIKMNNYPIVLAFKVGIEFTFACFNLN